MKGLGCWENRQGREFSIDSLHITASDMHVGSCLLITAQIYTRRLLCYQVPGTICWLLCEKIGQTRASHFPPNYPHLVVLLQAAWTGKRGKKEEAKGKMKDVKKQDRDREEKTVHQPLNHFVNNQIVETWTSLQQWGFYFTAVVILRASNGPWPNELSYLHPPPTYPASRGKRRGGKKGRLWIELMSLDWGGGGWARGSLRIHPFPPSILCFLPQPFLFSLLGEKKISSRCFQSVLIPSDGFLLLKVESVRFFRRDCKVMCSTLLSDL